MNKHKHKEIWIGIAIAILAVLFCWLFKFYPIAMVGSNLIWVREWQNDLATAKRLDPQADPDKVYQQLVLSKKKFQLVRDLRLKFDNSTFNDELNFYKQDKGQEYNQFLQDYFSGKESEFVNYVVVPQVFDALLRIKHNSDFAANNDAYNKAENIISKLDSGQTFDDLAKTYSDDKVSAQLGGDLGFVGPNQLLPELAHALANSKLGEVRKDVVISRLGYHILYPVEVSTKDGQKVWHLKHILIQTSGFEDWLAKQLN